ncbi:MAG TPA: M1 family metallopeptidase [Gemmatimonadota bacterium]|nr:M1 family metallopeptidase [Gemmatimonadota bacterium]
MRTRIALLTLSVALLPLACASGGGSGGGSARSVEAAPPPVQRLALERPIPYPVDLPANYARAIERGTRAANGAPGPRYWQQWAEYEIAVRLDTDARRLDGTTTIQYRNASPDTLRALVVQLLQNLHAPTAPRSFEEEVTGGVELRRVAVAGAELAALEGDDEGPGWQVSSTRLFIRPPSPVLPGGTIELAFDFGFPVPQAGASGRMGYSGEDMFYLAYFYPQMAVYDDVAGWDTDRFTGQAEFYADFGRYAVTIDAPANWLVDGTGTLENPGETLAMDVRARLDAAAASDSVIRVLSSADYDRPVTLPGRNGRIEWRFAADSVHDVAYSVTRRTNWDVTRTPVGDRDRDGAVDYARIGSIWRDSAPRWQHQARYGAHSIAHHSEFTGISYPWPHMTSVEGGGIIGGGMEYPMMTLIGDYNERGDTALYAVTAHELAHMWVPMIVANNERRYAWMDEGTTTFNENQAKKDFFPGTNWDLPEVDSYLEVARAELEGSLMTPSDYHLPGPGYGIASYDKPATGLATLRAILGEDTFLRGYREYLRRWSFKHPYPWDFFATFEDVSGIDLDWFWRGWYYETWTLDQAVGGVRVDGDRSTVFVEDRGRLPMPVPLTIRCRGGETVERTIPVDPWLAGLRQTSIEVDCAVESVTIDAARSYPDADRANNSWEGMPAS